MAFLVLFSSVRMQFWGPQANYPTLSAALLQTACLLSASRQFTTAECILMFHIYHSSQLIGWSSLGCCIHMLSTIANGTAPRRLHALPHQYCKYVSSLSAAVVAAGWVHGCAALGLWRKSLPIAGSLTYGTRVLLRRFSMGSVCSVQWNGACGVQMHLCLPEARDTKNMSKNGKSKSA